MKKILVELFGNHAADALIITREGVEYLLVRHLCDYMGINSEYHAVEDLQTNQELNLTREEKRRFYLEELYPNRPVWFVSEAGMWKIIARSHCPWAMSFRTRMFMENVPRRFRRRPIIEWRERPLS